MKKLPKIKTIRNKCDALLTPIIKNKFPTCFLCGGVTEVAHHFVHKSKSTRLRYEMENLINLCNPCHYTLHQNEGYWSSKIVEYKGIQWFKKIDKMKNEQVKADVHYYIFHLTRLTDIHSKLSTDNV